MASNVTVKSTDGGYAIFPALLQALIAASRMASGARSKSDAEFLREEIRDWRKEVMLSWRTYTDVVSVKDTEEDWAQASIDLPGLIADINLFGAEYIVDGSPLIHISVED